MENIVLGAIMPHPPILVPEIGRERISEAPKSKAALTEISARMKKKAFDSIMVISPHAEVGQASVPVYTSHIFEGDFGTFGLPRPHFSFNGDAELARAIIKDCELAASCPETVLDHGMLVPLYFVNAAGIRKPIVPMGIAFMPLPKLFEFGKSLARSARRLGRKVLIIASADMSHRLTPDAPSGFNPRGKEFDEQLVKLVSEYNVKGILHFDAELAEAAAQDSLWSIAILLGAMDGLKVSPEVLSYEGPFGVGYMIAAFEPK